MGIGIRESATPITIGNGATAELLGTTGIDVTDYEFVAMLLNNVGGNTITAIAAYWSLDSAGTRWSPADASVTISSPIAATTGTSLIKITEVCGRKLRLTATNGSGGTSAFVDILAKSVARNPSGKVDL